MSKEGEFKRVLVRRDQVIDCVLVHSGISMPATDDEEDRDDLNEEEFDNELSDRADGAMVGLVFANREDPTETIDVDISIVDAWELILSVLRGFQGIGFSAAEAGLNAIVQAIDEERKEED